MVADGQIVLRVDTSPQDNGAGSGPELVAASEVALATAPAAMAVCDYDLGALGEGFVAWLRDQRAALPLLAVDSHHLGRWREVHPTLVKPNFAEMAELLDTSDHWPDVVANRASTVERHAELILDRTGTRIAAVTLDIEGAMVLDGQVAPIRTATQAAPASHAVGAGDAYLAALTLAVASGAPLTEAATVAQRAAAASV